MHVTPEVKARITALFAGYAVIIKTRYGIDMPSPITSYTKGGTDGGVANYRHWTINFNPTLLMQNIELFLSTTVPHEYAHLACDKIYPDAHKTTIKFSRFGGSKRTKRDVHGTRWQSIMHVLGVANPTRCHQYDVTDVKRKRATYKYKCSLCQSTLELGPKIHAQLTRNPTSRWHSSCKGHRLVFVGNAAPAAPVTPRVVQPTPSAPAPLDVSKLDRCMAIYRSNKFLDRSAMIRLFTAQVGMTAAGASTYYYKCKG